MNGCANRLQTITFEDNQKMAMNADRSQPIRMPTTIASQRILRAIVDERRRALSRTLHGPHRRPAPPLESRLAELKSQADAYKKQAIVLNAKLAAMSGEPFQAMRETLVQSSAQIDHGVSGIVGDSSNESSGDSPTDS